MSVAIVTGSAGLVGSEAVKFLHRQGMDVVGIDNDMRAQLFGREASTARVRQELIVGLPRYRHFDVDIRSKPAIQKIFDQYRGSISLVIHSAAQPSHDWAARQPATDFTVNANGTSVMLEAARRSAPDAVFIFMSTNKVYGDRPNSLPLIEQETRWEIHPAHTYAGGIPETMPVDACLHSLFGVSKLAADLLVQEYGRYFGMKTVCFRGGCLTGPNHAGAELHGFLSYLVKCVVTGRPYTVYGYKGKQVRDNIHSADLVAAFWEFFKNPRCGEVYNMGGGRFSNCSVLEAIAAAEEVAHSRLDWRYVDSNRIGDHIWWISDLSRFQQHYPNWLPAYDIPTIIREIHDGMAARERQAVHFAPLQTTVAAGQGVKGG